MKYYYKRLPARFASAVFTSIVCVSMGAASICFADEQVVDDSSMDVSASADVVTETAPDQEQTNSPESNTDGSTAWQKSSKWMVESHDELSKKIEAFGLSLDDFFSGEAPRPDQNNSFVRLRLGAQWISREGVDNDSDFKFRLDLPATKERYRIVIESESEEDQSLEELNRPSQLSNKSPNRDSMSAALRFVSSEADRWKTDLDLGIRTRIPLDPFIRGTAKREWELADYWLGRIEQRLSYFHSESFSAKTTITFDRPIDDSLLFRHKSAVEWDKLEDKMQFIDVTQWLKRLDDRSTANFQFGILGSSLSHTRIDDYYIGIDYRRRLYRDWLYVDVVPELNFPRENDFEMTPSLSVRLEVLFTKSHWSE